MPPIERMSALLKSKLSALIASGKSLFDLLWTPKVAAYGFLISSLLVIFLIVLLLWKR